MIVTSAALEPPFFLSNGEPSALAGNLPDRGFRVCGTRRLIDGMHVAYASETFQNRVCDLPTTQAAAAMHCRDTYRRCPRKCFNRDQ